MKKLFTLICLLGLAAGSAFAQKMLVKMTDNGTLKIDLTKVESMTFMEDDFVDLGLPSGTLWAKCNIGAFSPEEYGDYFAWGETTTKSEYISGNYTFADNPTELPAENDAARANWGAEWQMPTLEQCLELYNSDYTSSEWTQVNGVSGMKVTSLSNGKSIFLPAAGYYNVMGLNSLGSTGTYWTASSNGASAYELYLSSSGFAKYGADRSCGRTIRPVRAPEAVPVEFVVLSQTSLGLLVGNTQTLTAIVLPGNAYNKTLTWESSDASIATVDQTGKVTAKAVGSCVITCSATDDSDVCGQCMVKVINSVTPYECVDLGLPSGTLWATKNIGAEKPENYGFFFAWGETTPKGNYTWSTYKWTNGGETDGDCAYNINKYTFADEVYSGCWYYQGNFIGDGKMELDSDDDAATVNWGDEWQMPSYEQCLELFDSNNTTITVMETGALNAVYKVTSKKNGNFIYLPRAGSMVENEHNWGESHQYLLRSLITSYNTTIFYSMMMPTMCLYPDGRIGINYGQRCHGYPVRPVRKQ